MNKPDHIADSQAQVVCSQGMICPDKERNGLRQFPRLQYLQILVRKTVLCLVFLETAFNLCQR